MMARNGMKDVLLDIQGDIGLRPRELSQYSNSPPFVIEPFNVTKYPPNHFIA